MAIVIGLAAACCGYALVADSGHFGHVFAFSGLAVVAISLTIGTVHWVGLFQANPTSAGPAPTAHIEGDHYWKYVGETYGSKGWFGSALSIGFVVGLVAGAAVRFSHREA